MSFADPPFDDDSELPRAVIHPDRGWRRGAAAVLITIPLVLLCGGTIMVRIDRAQLTADTARAETRLLRAELEQHAIAESQRTAIAHRDTKPENCELALRRTAALRSAIFALSASRRECGRERGRRRDLRVQP